MLNRPTQQAVMDCLLEYYVYKGHSPEKSAELVASRIALGVGPFTWAGFGKVGANFVPELWFDPNAPEKGVLFTNKPEHWSGTNAYEQYRAFVRTAIRFRGLIQEGIYTHDDAVQAMRHIHPRLWEAFGGFFR